jgi:endonuclease YncB( thermonuclease family)
LILFLLFHLKPGLAASQVACPAEGKEMGRVVDVTARLELLLEDAKLIKMAGIEAPRPTPLDPDLDRKTQAQVREWLKGQEIGFRRTESERDRWRRTPAFVFVTVDASKLSVNKALIESGLVRFEPSEDTRACRADFIEAETDAREAAFGLWTDPYYAILRANQREAFTEKAGSFVIVEGQVTNLDSNAFRASLYFGPRRARDFSITIPQRKLKMTAGLHLAHFIGQTVRVRGLLDTRFGPQIELSNLDELEVIVEKPIEAGLKPNVLTSQH